MLISDYQLPEQYAQLVRSSFSAAILLEDETEVEPRPNMLVWRQAMFDPFIQEGLGQLDWPLRILAAFPGDRDWSWTLKTSDEIQVINDWQSIVTRVRAASGIDGSPLGNVHCTLNLRGYEERQSFVGGLDWWRAQSDRLILNDDLTRHFVSKLIGMLSEVRKLGFDFHVEQICLILAKDSSDRLSTLTPTLHSDTYYGPRETALCSLTQESCNRFRGTLFAPTVRMDSLEEHRPIDIVKMFDLLGSQPILEAQSGDLVVYDGMIDRFGVTSTKNGAPHISPDFPGSSSRLLILMRNDKIQA